MALPIPIVAGSLARSGGMLAAQVIGLDSFVGAAVTFGRILAKHALRNDSKAAQDMVDRMQADAPIDEGDLHNGITWRKEGGEFVVEASAIDPRKGGADYAGFVERGTRAGVRGRRVGYVADESYFDLSVNVAADGSTAVPRSRRYARSRRQYRAHPGTAAQPYFFHNAEAVLKKRALIHKANVALAVAEAGLAVYAIAGAAKDIVKLTGYSGVPRLTRG